MIDSWLHQQIYSKYIYWNKIKGDELFGNRTYLVSTTGFTIINRGFKKRIEKH